MMFENAEIKDWSSISDGVCKEYKTDWFTVVDAWVNPENPEANELEQLILDTVDAVRDAEHKATLRAVVKWLDEPCRDPFHTGSFDRKAECDGSLPRRWYCNACRNELRKAVEEGSSS